jgi:major vault protein
MLSRNDVQHYADITGVHVWIDPFWVDLQGWLRASGDQIIGTVVGPRNRIDRFLEHVPGRRFEINVGSATRPKEYLSPVSSPKRPDSHAATPVPFNGIEQLITPVRLECRNAKHNKFWEIGPSPSGRGLTTRFGPIGGTPRVWEKEYRDLGEVHQQYGKMISEKLGKGYVRVGEAPRKKLSNVDDAMAKIRAAVVEENRNKVEEPERRDMSETREKRDLVLAPGEYAFMQDVTKGVVKVYTGPTVINPTAQEAPVVYDPQRAQFVRVNRLEDAVRKSVVAPQGFYIALTNPAKNGSHPQDGSSQPSPDLDIGRKINVPGPCSFALWPGQDAQLIRGHHLRSNQYLLVKVYDEEEARKNWIKAIAKPAATDKPAAPSDGVVTAETPAPITARIPADLSVGRLFIIRGDEYSFYMPPTGVAVVPDDPANKRDAKGKPIYVRDALTLERLEYCILVDEDGNKRYERGPQVVFPSPTERFLEAEDNSGGKSRKFRAIELNEIQGLHIKVIAPYEDENGQKYDEGDEIFLTGTETSIYFPRPEHSLIRYDGKSKHFATAVPEGEARYVMNRLTGEIDLVHGPAMLLPDPRTSVIVRRVLTDAECELWYPGNSEALEYNRQLRDMIRQVPTTRAGAVSEGDYSRLALQGTGSGPKARKTAAVYSTESVGSSVMEQSNLHANNALMADEFVRAATFSQPRTLTLETKFQGVPSVSIWTGYAVQVTSKTGERRVEVGPKTVLLGYDETLEVLKLSTGKPKNTDRIYRTAYLKVKNNQVGDIVQLESSDHVGIEAKLSLLVDFTGDPNRWFDVENYVKFLCDHVRSVLKGAAQKLKAEEIYANSVDFIRDSILGKKVAKGARDGMLFEENGMLITDVEVLEVKIKDERIRKLLESSQFDAVSSSIELSAAERRLETTRAKERISREEQDARAETQRHGLQLETEGTAAQLAAVVAKLDALRQENEKRRETQQQVESLEDLKVEAALGRERRREEQALAQERERLELKLTQLKEETAAVVARFAASQAGFSEALLVLSNNELLTKVSEALSVQKIVGGQNFAEAVGKLFENTPLAPIMARAVEGSGAKRLTNGAKNGASAPAAPKA